MEYIIAGHTAYIAGFYEDIDELVNYFPVTLINTLELQGVTKVVWGIEGEHWELLDSFPRMEN